MLRQMLMDNDEKHEQAHKRLREDWREHDRRLETLERDRHAMLATLGSIESTLKQPKWDVSTLRLTFGQMAVVVSMCLTLGGLLAEVTFMKLTIDTLQHAAAMQDVKLNNLEVAIAKIRSLP